MTFKIKIIFNIVDQEYIVFVDGINNIEGYGSTEQEAIEDFEKNLKLKLSN